MKDANAIIQDVPTDDCPHCRAQGQRISVRAGPYIRKLRLRKRLSLRELAKRACISPTHLCDMELGRKRISEYWLEAFAGILGDKR